jgi:NADH-quinone oxidoreductase E subunit
MARLTAANVQRARDLIALYPEPRSALIPILHVAQEQEGWLPPDVIAHIGELLGLSTAEVFGTASFYDMLFTQPVGKHLVSVCTNIACLLNGGEELLEHAEERLGVKAGGTTADGEFTLEEVECIALCGEAPCLAVNWRFFGNVTDEGFDALIDDLKAGMLRETVPPHGTLNRVRRAVGLAAAGASTTKSSIPVSAGGEPPSKPGDVPPAGYPEAKPTSAGDSERAASDAGAVTRQQEQGKPAQGSAES